MEVYFGCLSNYLPSLSSGENIPEVGKTKHTKKNLNFYPRMVIRGSSQSSPKNFLEEPEKVARLFLLQRWSTSRIDVSLVSQPSADSILSENRLVRKNF